MQVGQPWDGDQVGGISILGGGQHLVAKSPKLNLTSEETIIVVVPTAYHNMLALVCVVQVAGQSVLEEPHESLSVVQHSKEQSIVPGAGPAPCAGPIAQKPSPWVHHLLFITKRATVS